LATLTVSRPISNSGAQADLMPANTSRVALKDQEAHLDLHEETVLASRHELLPLRCKPGADALRARKLQSWSGALSK
jgi:hypothetical protein